MKSANFIALAIILLSLYGLYYQLSPRAAYAASLSIQLPHSDHPIDWPPQRGKPYPNLVLVNQRGELTRLSDFKGKILLIEPIGMNCPASNSLAGGRTKGGFNGTVPERDINSAELNFKTYAKGISFDDPRIVHISLLLYNFSMQGPQRIDAQLWAEHFGYDKRPNFYVLAGGNELINRTSYDLIPGFQLVDEHFILRADSTGHQPIGWNQVMAMIPILLKE